MKIEINRKKWARGEGNGRLLNDESGKMCCLGFVCLAFGLSNREIADYSMPRNLMDASVAKLPAWLTESWRKEETEMRTDVELASNINDSMSISNSEREQQIIDIFARHDLHAVFVD